MSGMLRVCLISPGHLSTNPRLVKEAFALKEARHAVHVINGSYKTWGAENDLAIASAIGSVEAVPFGPELASLPVYLRQTTLRRAAQVAAGIGTGSLKVVETAHSSVSSDLSARTGRYRADLYIAHYVAALPAAARAARRFGARYAFDAEDFHLGDLPNTPKNRLEKDIIRRIESRYLPGAGYVTAASPMIAEAYAQAYDIPLPITILNVFPKTNAPAAPTPRGSIDPGPSLYWFSQTVGAGRGLETAIEAIARANSRPHIYLRGTPARGYEAALRDLAARKGVSDRLHFLAPAPPNDLERLGAQFDVGLVSELDETYNRQIALTNKLFSYLTSGLPSVASDIPSHRRIAPDLGEAMSLYPTGDPAGLAAAIDALMLNPDRLASVRAHSWELGQRRYSWESERGLLVSMVARLQNCH